MSAPHVLLFSYELGPTGHTGGFRWDALTRLLAGRGYAFDVVTSATSQAATEGLDYGPNVRLHPVEPDWAGRRLRRALAGLRGTDTVTEPPPAREEPRIPPADAPRPMGRQARDGVWSAYFHADDTVWMRRAVRAGLAAARDRKPDMVVATLPEWRVPSAGLAVARRLGVPFGVDLRDPWYFGRGRFVASLDLVTRARWRRDELAVMRGAAIAIDGADESGAAAGGELAALGIKTPRATVNNAAPARDVVGPVDPDRFVIAFTGFMYDFQDPRGWLAAAGRLRARHGLGPDRLAVRMLGTGATHGGASLAGMAARAGLDGVFRAEGRVPKPEAQALTDSAALLVLLDFPHATQVPSKLFHYLGARGRTLIVGEPDGATARLGARAGATTVRPDDPDGLDRAMEAAFQAWRAGASTQVADAEGRFTWARSADAMAKVLETLA